MKSQIALYFFVILISGWSADAAEVTMRPTSHAKGSLVLLGDVADVTSTDAKRAEQLRRVELFPAPARNRSKLMHVRELAELMLLNGVDMSDIEFKGVRTTRIYAPSQSPTVIPAGLVTAPIESPEMVIVARRALNRGDIIREVDVELQPIDPKAKPQKVAIDRRSVVGMELLSPIREGQTIWLNQMRKPLLVKRGEVMRVIARAPGVQITTTARATQDGARGDIILVQALDTREKYSTSVTGLRQVEVFAAGVVASEPTRSFVPARLAADRPNPLTVER